MSAHMDLESTGAHEGDTAFWTAERPVSRMLATVICEMSLCGEAQLAFRTLIRPVTTVNAHMRIQIALLSEPLATLLALEGSFACVLPHVHLQGA